MSWRHTSFGNTGIARGGKRKPWVLQHGREKVESFAASLVMAKRASKQWVDNLAARVERREAVRKAAVRRVALDGVEANLSFYSLEALRRREHLRKDKTVQQLLYDLYVDFADDGGLVSRESYSNFHRRIIHHMLPRVSAAERASLEQEDWARDSSRLGGGPLGWQEFADAVFALVDVWTKGISRRQYVSFLVNTIKALRSKGKRGGRGLPRRTMSPLRHTRSSTTRAAGGGGGVSPQMSRASTSIAGSSVSSGFGAFAAARRAAKHLRKVTVGRFDFKLPNRPGLPEGFGPDGVGVATPGAPTASKGLTRAQVAKNRAERMLQRAMSAVGGAGRSRVFDQRRPSAVGSTKSLTQGGNTSSAARIGQEISGRGRGGGHERGLRSAASATSELARTGPHPPASPPTRGFGASRARRLQDAVRSSPGVRRSTGLRASSSATIGGEVVPKTGLQLDPVLEEEAAQGTIDTFLGKEPASDMQNGLRSGPAVTGDSLDYDIGALAVDTFGQEGDEDGGGAMHSTGSEYSAAPTEAAPSDASGRTSADSVHSETGDARIGREQEAETIAKRTTSARVQVLDCPADPATKADRAAAEMQPNNDLHDSLRGSTAAVRRVTTREPDTAHSRTEGATEIIGLDVTAQVGAAGRMALDAPTGSPPAPIAESELVGDGSDPSDLSWRQITLKSVPSRLRRLSLAAEVMVETHGSAEDETGSLGSGMHASEVLASWRSRRASEPAVIYPQQAIGSASSAHSAASDPSSGDPVTGLDLIQPGGSHQRPSSAYTAAMRSAMDAAKAAQPRSHTREEVQSQALPAGGVRPGSVHPARMEVHAQSEVEPRRIKAEMLPGVRTRRMSVVKALARAAIMMHRLSKSTGASATDGMQQEAAAPSATIADAEQSLRKLSALRHSMDKESPSNGDADGVSQPPLDASKALYGECSGSDEGHANVLNGVPQHVEEAILPSPDGRSQVIESQIPSLTAAARTAQLPFGPTAASRLAQEGESTPPHSGGRRSAHSDRATDITKATRSSLQNNAEYELAGENVPQESGNGSSTLSGVAGHPVFAHGATMAWGGRHRDALLSGGISTADYLARRPSSRYTSTMRGRDASKATYSREERPGYLQRAGQGVVVKRPFRAGSSPVIPRLDLGRAVAGNQAEAWESGASQWVEGAAWRGILSQSGGGLTRNSRLNAHMRSIVFGQDVTDGVTQSARAHPDAADVSLGKTAEARATLQTARARTFGAGSARGVLTRSAQPQSVRLDPQEAWREPEKKADDSHMSLADFGADAYGGGAVGGEAGPAAVGSDGGGAKLGAARPRLYDVAGAAQWPDLARKGMELSSSIAQARQKYRKPGRPSTKECSRSTGRVPSYVRRPKPPGRLANPTDVGKDKIVMNRAVVVVSQAMLKDPAVGYRVVLEGGSPRCIE